MNSLKTPKEQLTVTIHSQSTEPLRELLKKILLEKARHI